MGYPTDSKTTRRTAGAAYLLASPLTSDAWTAGMSGELLRAKKTQNPRVERTTGLAGKTTRDKRVHHSARG